MATFPNLKTGAVTQHPLQTKRSFRTEVMSFVDGTEQRFPMHGRALRSWVLTYSQIEESEMQRLREFIAQNTDARFSFVDPQSAVVHASCRLASWQLQEAWAAEESGRARVEITEVLD